MDWAPEELFCTVTVKLPAVLSVVEPINSVAFFVVRLPLDTVQGAQPEPVNWICAVLGSKLLPLMSIVNCWPAVGDDGLVTRAVRDGVGVPMTSVSELDWPPHEPFCA